MTRGSSLMLALTSMVCTAPRDDAPPQKMAEQGRLPRVAPRDGIHTSNRLVDLYLAWPGHGTKGLRELSRLIDTYPETQVAARARAGLVNLKSQLGIAE
jgi:hypothetical protein